MTRFARFGQNNKRTLDATQWNAMKTDGNTGQTSGGATHANNDNSNSKDSPQKSPLKGVKNDSNFQRPKHKGQKGKFPPKGQFRRNQSEMECYNCHQKGHKVSDCPEPGDGKHLDVQCYNCKQKGHKSFNCPKPPRRREMDGKGRKNPKFSKFMETNKEDWKHKRSEHRRLQRQDDAQSKLHCYNCRETGHKLSECPEIQKDVEHGTDICFKCGSTEHSIKGCNIKLAPGEYPYAKCFICGELGHLSQKCPDNPRGLYPNGGCCKECGSVEHLQRDCPEHQRQQGIGSITLERLEGTKSVDQDQLDIDQEVVDKSAFKTKPKKAAKVVKF